MAYPSKLDYFLVVAFVILAAIYGAVGHTYEALNSFLNFHN